MALDQAADRHPSTYHTRPIPLQGAYNFRDLGGHSVGARRVRSRLVYRSDGLHRLSRADLARLRRLGIRTVIDLRSTEERQRFGTCSVGALGAAYHHVPLVEQRFPPPGDGEAASTWLAGCYCELLSSSAVEIITVLQLLADSDSWPAVFHCTGGKDRTGVVAAVLLGILGVSDEDIIEDYCRSTPGVTWLRQSFEAERAGAAGYDVPAAIFEVPPAAMWLLLDSIAVEHGSMETWAITAGMPPSTIGALRAGLLA